ncbi:MMPL family transporter [Streptomyces sp. NBC_00841]|uniref:MMPL family transporter n=1 Tax=unclassified Streptomyces TaxID=2593676 RepID=UPI00225BA1A7|nr:MULTISPECIES: MMPL family transporter [unclassified Streptomyces]MCX4532025.1 MMPL family transporter [Streptomyces sp. NBC_01669]WSA02453.1 MMPL family transporter [Streptomyces sp. NBC_00841]
MSRPHRWADRLLKLPGGRKGKWLTLITWLIIVVASVPLAGQLSDIEKDELTIELPRGAESTDVAGLADRFADGKISLGIVVYVRDSGLTAEDKAKVASDIKEFASFAAGEVGPARPSDDGKALTAFVPLDKEDSTALADNAEKVRDRATADRPDGLEAKLTGPAGNSLDAADARESTGRALTLITVLVVAALLLITYRSAILWLLPLLTVGVAFLTTQAVSYLLAKGFGLTVGGGNEIVVTALLFGVGTDYAMLLLARYREELRVHEDRHEAMQTAVRRAVPAIAASAATVSIGLLCLTQADVGFNYTLGPAGAIAIICGLAAMTTLFPAVLVILGRWVFWPNVPRAGVAVKNANHRLWDRVGGRISRRPRLVWIGSALVLTVLALGSLGLKTGLDDEHLIVGKPGSIAGQELLADHYPAGQSRPAEVISKAGAAPAVAAALKGIDGVAEVAVPEKSTDGTLASTRAVLKDSPDSAAAARTVDRIRTAVHAVPGADAQVGGPTAMAQEKTEAQAHDRKVVIPLVLAVVFLILVVLLRALVAPLLLMATVVLSYFAALGISWQLFQHVLGFPAVDIQVMLIGFLFLVALGVDYNIFLIHRIREEVGHRGHRAGVLSGLTSTGGVITSAGAVLAATFAALTTAPQVAFIEIGIVVAIGVLIDTFLVRSVLVPALALDVGRTFWWPGRPVGTDTVPPAAGEQPTPAAVPAGSRGGGV